MKVVVVTSGGMDSTTLLFSVVKQGYDVYGISFDYNQRHKKELECARYNCDVLEVSHKVVDLSCINPLIQGSALTSPDVEVPEGHYEEESMKATVVPNRNMIMLSLSIAYAISIDAKKVFYGAHAGDHAIYPDCRAEFVHAIQKVAQLCDWKQVEVVAPFLHIDKGGIVGEGIKLGMMADGSYAHTWTCYKGKEKACGKCGACQERLLAFEANGVEDPLEYEDRPS